VLCLVAIFLPSFLVVVRDKLPFGKRCGAGKRSGRAARRQRRGRPGCLLAGRSTIPSGHREFSEGGLWPSVDNRLPVVVPCAKPPWLVVLICLRVASLLRPVP